MSIKQLVGKKFGRLLVVKLGSRGASGRIRWLCLCDCGTEKEILSTSLVRGNTKSCGCYNKEVAVKSNRKHRGFKDYGNYYGVYLNNGDEALVDVLDYALIKDSSWTKGSNGYVVCTKNRINYLMHRVILGVTDSKIEVDHINHNIMDNRRSNLRLSEHRHNLRNRSLGSNNTTGFPGVYLDKRRNLWYSRIEVDGDKIYLGSFENKIDAIEARKDADLKYFGEYSNITNILYVD